MKVWICAIAKMEELYIREWIEWNKQIGIDHIVLGDNNNSDYNKPLKTIIQDYIDEGYVELINKNDVLGVAEIFYKEIYQLKKNEFDWIGFIDIDEFIELPVYNNDIHLFLSNNKLKYIDAVIFPWLQYGDNEYLYYEDKPVKSRFTTPTKLKSVGIKYFIRSLDNISITSHHNPIKFIDKNKCCDTLFHIITDDFGVKRDDGKLFTSIYVNETYYNNAYISHYITKSTEEYIKFKILRGRVSGSIGKYKLRYDINFYYWINKKTIDKDKLFEKYKQEIINAEQHHLKKYNMI